MEALQIYWWFVISLLAGLLVWLLFVQGGQTLIRSASTEVRRSLVVNVLGRKWELTFTTLVLFGGAFFASFPLYYSTSFGGAYWLWMLILLSFILQAVSYEFRSKPGNVFGTKTYDTFLAINGCVGCVLLGVAVGMQFFGAEFSISRQNILNPAAPVISVWNASHGFDSIFSLPNLLLGFTVFYLARTEACLFFLRSFIDPMDGDNRKRLQLRIMVNGGVFTLLFLCFCWALFQANGYGPDPQDPSFIIQYPNKYFWNMIDLWWVGASFVFGVILVLYGIVRSYLQTKWHYGFWFTGVGTVIVVVCLFCVSGYNDTAYLPSLSDPQSSLTIYNSSSTEFTLSVMAWVTCLIPIVIGYIAYVWRKMTYPPMTVDELKSTHHY